MKLFYTQSGVRMEQGEESNNSSDDANSDAIEGGYFNLDTVIEVDDNGKGGEKTPLTMGGQPLGMRIKAVLKGFKEETVNYDALTGNPQNLRRNLSAFAGVFAPVALGQFANNLFLRTGFVVGQAGLLETFTQLVLAYFILTMTVLSICAISTNGALEGGGAYYMISRALGPEFGGSIGFLFYVANILACALYISGFVEGIIQNFGVDGSFMSPDTGLPSDSSWWKYLYGTISLFICLLVCIVGGAMFARTSAFILLIVVICTLSVMISIFVKNDTIVVNIPTTNDIAWHNKTRNDSVTGNYTGLSTQTFRENLYSNYTIDYSTDQHMNYATVFAILFSSVTGILNGANMSGELKDPSKAIPRGTMSAVCFTFVTYFFMAILVGGSCSRFLLVNDYVFLQQVNIWPPFVVVGIFAATLSAALGNLIGASRVLEALGNDQLFWFVLKPATMTTKGGNPILSVVMSWFLVQCVLLVGSLNEIAPVTSVFFLLSYAATNLACLALELASAPNFRPTFVYFSWHTCALGMVGCMVMCFLIHVIYTSVALVLMLMLVILLHFRSLPTTWGSISQALIFHQVRKYLLMLDPRKAHVKYWRPQILLMVANPRQSCELMDFCNDIKKSGLYVLGHVKIGNLDNSSTDPVLDEMPRWLQLIQHMKIKAFAEVTLASSVCEGFQHLVRISGLGGMKVNTVCFGFYDDMLPSDSLLKTKTKRRRFFGAVERGEYLTIESFFDSPRVSEERRSLSRREYVQLILDALKLQKNVCLCRNFQLLNKDNVLKSQTKSCIDVWPVNFFRLGTLNYFDNTCLFMLQLACILTMQHGWKQHTDLRVFLCVKSSTENTTLKEQKLSVFLRQLRIQAKIIVVSCEQLYHRFIKEGISQTPLAEDDNSGEKMHEYAECSDSYLTAVNELMQAHSSRAAVTFLYLPRPPEVVDQHERFLAQLDLLTDTAQPAVMVHGLHPVTSTTL